MVKVWFNHWFSTAHQIIRLLKEDKETEFHVTGTGILSRAFAAIQAAEFPMIRCEEFYRRREQFPVLF